MNKRNLNLEQFYLYINDHILLAEKFTEIKHLSSIIKSCRLKPSKMFEEGRILKDLVLHNNWFDEFRNSFKILKNKTIKITYNDLSVKHYPSTDLYYGLSIENIYKISKLMFLFAGTDEDNDESIYLLSLLGIDDYLRTYLFDGEWNQVSSLLLGMENLKFIFKNSDIKYFKKSEKINNTGVPCNSGVTWLSYLPANEKLVRELEDLYGADLPFLKIRKGYI